MESMETERRVLRRRRRPLSDCTNLFNTPKNRNTINKTQNLAIPNSNSPKSTFKSSVNVASNPTISSQASTSPLNIVDGNCDNSETSIIYSSRKPVVKVKEKGIHIADDNLETPRILKDSSQRKRVAQVKGKENNIPDVNFKHPETPIDDIQRNHVQENENVIHIADVNCKHPESPVDGSQRKHLVKGKEKMIHIADVTCMQPETPRNESQRRPVAKGKEIGIRIVDANCKNPVTPVDYIQRKLIAKEKEKDKGKGKAIDVAPFSCPPLGRAKSIRDQQEKEKHNMHKRNAEQSGLAMPKCYSAPPAKKQRHSMPGLPQKFVEEKKAYYDTIDAFELEEEVVSGNESE